MDGSKANNQGYEGVQAEFQARRLNSMHIDDYQRYSVHVALPHGEPKMARSRPTIQSSHENQMNRPT
jgi:hypothetical protein